MSERKRYNSKDIIYMRWINSKGEVERVVRHDRFGRTLNLVLIPTDDPDKFIGEGFNNDIDQDSAQLDIEKSEVNDKVWLRLLAGEDTADILKDYHHEGFEECGDSYLYEGKDELFKRSESRTFHISPDFLESPKAIAQE